MKKKRLLGIALSLLLPALAQAEWGPFNLVETVRRSEVVVLATLIEIGNDDDLASDPGILEVSESLRGEIPKDSKLAVTWRILGPCGPAVPDSAIGAPRIYFLERDGKDGYWIGHPGCCMAADEKAVVLTSRKIRFFSWSTAASAGSPASTTGWKSTFPEPANTAGARTCAGPRWT